jgi:hypothetical protein
VLTDTRVYPVVGIGNGTLWAHDDTPRDARSISDTEGTPYAGARPYTTSSVSGYWGHCFCKYVGPDTVVIDLRPMGLRRMIRHAISGPMLNTALPSGTVSRLGARLERVRDGSYTENSVCEPYDLSNPPRALDYVSLDVYLDLARAMGAAILNGTLPDDIIKMCGTHGTPLTAPRPVIESNPWNDPDPEPGEV